MAEHLHGYPRCETPAGQPCPQTDVNYVECHAHGPLESCRPSVVDGIPTGQYHCIHRDAGTAGAPRKKAAAKAKAKKSAKKKPAKKKPARKAARKAKGKKAGKQRKKK